MSQGKPYQGHTVSPVVGMHDVVMSIEGTTGQRLERGTVERMFPSRFESEPFLPQLRTGTD